MSNLEDQFEKETPYVAWINAEIYPNGRISTQEYVDWLEKKVKELQELVSQRIY